MTSALMALAILAAVTVSAVRRFERARRRRFARSGPGSSPARAIAIRSYAEMEAHLAPRACACGERLTHSGEGTREIEGRRFRVARLACQACETEEEVFFDTSTLRH